MVGRVGGGVFPVIGWHGLGFDVRVLSQEVEQVRSVDEFDGLVVGELEAGLAVAEVVTRIPLLAPSFCRVPNLSLTAETPTVFL